MGSLISILSYRAYLRSAKAWYSSYLSLVSIWIWHRGCRLDAGRIYCTINESVSLCYEETRHHWRCPPPPFSVLWMKQWHGPSSLRVGMFREQRLGTYVVQGKSLSEADREKNKQWLHKQTKKSVALCLQSERSRPTWWSWTLSVRAAQLGLFLCATVDTISHPAAVLI